MTTEQTDQERYTEAYLDFHNSWENRMNTCVNNLNNCRTSEEATTVIRAIEEIDTQLREFPFNRPEDQSSNLRQLGDVLDEAKFKFTHIRKMELAEQNKLLQAQIDAWGLPSKPIDAPFQNQAALLQHLQTITKQKLEAKLIGTKFRIYPKTPYAYHQIRRYIEENSLESHTYMLPEDKLLRAVIRGLPTDMSPHPNNSRSGKSRIPHKGLS
ncbi:hypothetical protein TNCV_3098291 [Trichonephila clavipes]|nr:hypothetical protein TNCV_3098291 [Trichonephila clavipes]